MSPSSNPSRCIDCDLFRKPQNVELSSAGSPLLLGFPLSANVA